jgi:hypothetical protein
MVLNKKIKKGNAYDDQIGKTAKRTEKLQTQNCFVSSLYSTPTEQIFKKQIEVIFKDLSLKRKKVSLETKRI